MKIEILRGDVVLDPTRDHLCEHGRYRVRVCSADEPRVMLSGAPLPERTVRHVGADWSAEFALEIDFYAGLVDLCVSSGEQAQQIRLEVDPAENKLGRQAHGQLLEELESWVESILIGGTAARTAFAMSAEPLKSMVARVMRLESRLSQLEEAFAAVRRSPQRRMISRREERALHRVREADRGTIRSVISRPGVRAALRGAAGPVCTVDHPLREETYDTPANRHIRAQLNRLGTLARRLARLLEREGSKEGFASETAEVRARHRFHASLCRNCESRLHRMGTARFLRDVRAQTAGAGALQTISWHPGYRRFDRLARAILRPALALGSGEDALPLRRTYELYEFWCLSLLEESLRRAIPEAAWNSRARFVDRSLFREPRSGRFLSGSLPDGKKVELWFQPLFHSYRAAKPPRRMSNSMELRPDFAIRLCAEDGGTERFTIFDAKYRSSRSAVHDSLRAAHVYRDALRWDGVCADGVYLLCPAVADDAVVYTRDAYLDAHRIGVLVARPDGHHDAVDRRVQNAQASGA